MMITKTYIKRFLMDSVRIFFAPLIGNYKQMRLELRRVDRDIRRNAYRKNAG
jgi:hypothetical protein